MISTIEMKKILVIEDNLQVRENICEILELAGYEAEGAENGKRGIESAVTNRPDLILCDVMMPELDGFGVLKILNQNSRTYDIPFIFLTARTEKEDIRKGMGLGADDYITKPFDDTELLEAIEMRLRKTEKLRNIKAKSQEGVNQFFSEARAENSLQELKEDREIRQFLAKDRIYSEGQQARWLYFILVGKVKIYQVNEMAKELITHVYGPDDFFGYQALLTDEKYKDNCMAMEECEILLIPKEDFNKLLYANRDFSSKFIKMMAREKTELEEQLIQQAYSSVRRKVANALISLITDKEMNIHMSREDLASIAGVAKETLIRTLSDFKSEKLINTEGSSIEVLEPDELKYMPQ